MWHGGMQQIQRHTYNICTHIGHFIVDQQNIKQHNFYKRQ